MLNVASYKKSIEVAGVEILKRVALGVDRALEARKVEAERLSPVDTGEYISGHKIQKATILATAGKVVGANLNDSEYAFNVEFGFSRSPVNRHKASSPRQPYSERQVIFTGVGAKVLTRTAVHTKDLVESFIQNAVK